MQSWQREQQRNELLQLTTQGYTFTITTDGYRVEHEGVFVGAASVMLPRRTPLHWRHRQPCLDGNRSSALIVARAHQRAHALVAQRVPMPTCVRA